MFKEERTQRTTQCISFSVRHPFENTAHFVIPAIGHLEKSMIKEKIRRSVFPRCYIRERDEWFVYKGCYRVRLFSLMLYWWTDVCHYTFAQCEFLCKLWDVGIKYHSRLSVWQMYHSGSRIVNGRHVCLPSGEYMATFLYFFSLSFSASPKHL